MIGIPLGITALFLYGILIYVSQIVVGIFVGRWLLSYLKAGEGKGVLIGALALGLFVLMLLRMVPILGFFVTFAGILFGLGALYVLGRAEMTKGNVPVAT